MSFTVITTMKNEAPFILEWVAHYKALGFDNIIICYNNCSDGTARLLRRLRMKGLVRMHKTMIRSGGIQRSALRQAMAYPEAKNADWVFVCDADEFLNIHVGDHTVQDLVAYSGDRPDLISIPWRNFGSSGLEGVEDLRVTQRFTLAERPYHPELSPDTGKFVKSLFTNFSKFKRPGLHFPIAHDALQKDLRWVLPGGTLYAENGAPTNNPPLFNVAQVNHYALRSLDNYLVKRDRGRANHTSHTIGIDYWKRFELNHEQDLTIQRYDDRFSRIYDNLRNDPRVMEHHNYALQWHRLKAAEMRQRPEIAEMISAIADHTGTVRLGDIKRVA